MIWDCQTCYLQWTPAEKPSACPRCGARTISGMPPSLHEPTLRPGDKPWKWKAGVERLRLESEYYGKDQ